MPNWVSGGTKPSNLNNPGSDMNTPRPSPLNFDTITVGQTFTLLKGFLNTCGTFFCGVDDLAQSQFEADETNEGIDYQI